MNESMDMRDAFFLELLNVAREDERIMVLTADHGAHSLVDFENEMPNRFINVGIAEQNMISVAAGLASQGKLPVAYGIAPFVSLRVLEQLTLDVAAMQLPVTVASIGSGFTYSTDGLTHHGLQDVSAILGLPQMTVLNSSDPSSTKLFARQTSTSLFPRYVRLEKGTHPNHLRANDDWRGQGWGEIRRGKSSNLVITTGVISHSVLSAVDEVTKIRGVGPTVVDVHRLSPLPDSGLFRIIQQSSSVLVIEESYPALGQLISFEVSKRQLAITLSFMHAPFRYFHEGGSRETMLTHAGLSEVDIMERILTMQDPVQA